MNKGFIALIILPVVAISTYLVFRGDHRSEATVETATALVENPLQVGGHTTLRAKDNETKGRSKSVSTEALGEPEQLGEFDIYSWNYKTPKFAKPQVYEFISYKPLFAKNCSAKDKSKLFDDVNKHITKTTGFDSTLQFPKTGNFRVFTQNWKLDGKFHSVSAQWQVSDPPVYELIYEISKSERSEDPTYPEIPNYEAGSLVDADTVIKIMESMLADAKANGAEEGARIVEIREIDANKSVHEATFVNQMPISYVNGKTFCSFPDNQNVVKCDCSFAQ